MKKILGLSACAVLVLTSLSTTFAAYEFDMGGESWVDTTGTNDALIMYAHINPDLDSVIFPLEPGQSETFFSLSSEQPRTGSIMMMFSRGV